MTRARREDLGSQYRVPGESPGLALWQVAAQWQRRIRSVLTPLELTHAQFVLLASATWLGRDQQVVTQVQISDLAHTDPVMTSEVLRTLEKRELLERLPHPEDGRARKVVVTSAGKRLARRAMAIVESEDAAFFGEPGPELRALASLLSDVVR